MTFEEAKDIVSKISAHPDIAYTVTKSEGVYSDTEAHLTLQFKNQLCAQGKPGLKPVVIRTIIGLSYQTPKQLVAFCFRLYKELMLHEVKEWFRFEGEYFEHPHPEQKETR